MTPITKIQVLRPALVIAALLLVPLVAMRFNDQVAWDAADFLVGGVLLFGAGFVFELVARRAGTTANRAAIGLAVFTGLLLVWVNLAVGLIGSVDDPANLFYLAVLVVGFVGAVLVRLRPAGMFRVMIATAAVQVLVPVVAILVYRPRVTTPVEATGMVGIIVSNAVFVLLLLASAFLFRRAAGTGTAARGRAQGTR